MTREELVNSKEYKQAGIECDKWSKQYESKMLIRKINHFLKRFSHNDEEMKRIYIKNLYNQPA